MKPKSVLTTNSDNSVRPIIITCAVTGSADTVHLNPAVPVTPKQIVAEIVAAREAGAAIAHVHVRDPKTGKPSRDLALYRDVVVGIRESGCDIILNLTTGPGARFSPNDEDYSRVGLGTTLASPQSRVEHILELRPDICSLDVGTLNYGSGTLINTQAHIKAMAALIRQAGVKPELEIFDLGHLALAVDLIREGLIEAPQLLQLCLGIPWGAPATTEALIAMKSALPKDANWCAFGISRHEFSIAAQAIALGGHVRVGLEDNLYISKGRLASGNAELVARAVQLIDLLGCRVASPREARALLGLYGASKTQAA